MNIEALREYCIGKPNVSEGFPFDEKTLVFKVAGKVFAITTLDEYPMKVNLKCDPEKAIEYRETYDEITSGYHMNKKHWNTIDFEGKLSNEFLKHLIDHSYDSVILGLTKKEKQELGYL
ncbi:MmcQ/YjbR family DNA-binding protein [Aureivirga sp. CE67]|uniref:MmcQ/YjbR family DNA-binding protein n=1 Tax=Aureivirga sp. CE67 TaxID=1788983 RepID=UPI0018CA9BCB|nr:MmcQ/YjbR family DNA-binding protein [Aureivirga sp. CE67]